MKMKGKTLPTVSTDMHKTDNKHEEPFILKDKGKEEVEEEGGLGQAVKKGATKALFGAIGKQLGLDKSTSSSIQEALADEDDLDEEVPPAKKKKKDDRLK